VIPSQAKGWSIDTLPHAKLVETDRADGAVSVLLAHIVSTRCRGDTVTDADMDYPKDWAARGGRSADVGNQEDGRSVAVHSLAVLPQVHGCGIGKTILKSYLQYMHSSGIAEKVTLICQDVRCCYSHLIWPKTNGCSIWSHIMTGSDSGIWDRARQHLEGAGGTIWYVVYYLCLAGCLNMTHHRMAAKFWS